MRILGADTPETVDPRKPVQCFGPEASAYTKRRLAPGTRVTLETDAEVRDKYGRLLAYVYVGGVRYDDELLRLGYAAPVDHPAQRRARARDAAGPARRPRPRARSVGRVRPLTIVNAEFVFRAAGYDPVRQYRPSRRWSNSITCWNVGRFTARIVFGINPGVNPVRDEALRHAPGSVPLAAASWAAT